MSRVVSHEAQEELASLLDLLVSGQDVVVMRHGKPVARLVAEDHPVDREKALKATAELVAMRQGVTLGGTVTIKELINEGRR